MTTTYLVPFEHSQQTDANGDPYSGALLYVYQSTTTTAVSLFSDSAGSTTAANPIVADSSGRLALRYTTYAGALTLVLKTSAGVTVWTQDDIYPVVHAGSLDFTGNVSIAKASAQLLLDSASGNVLLILDREAGNSAIVSGRTANSERWRAIPGNSTAEAGANAGSDYVIQAFDDSGSSLGNALVITRATLAAALGGALSVAGATTLTGAATGASSIKSSSATAGVGYATGAGGAVTQITNRSTGVTLNKICGAITTDTTSLAAEASATFVVTNSAVAINDTVIVSIQSGSNGGNTSVTVKTVAAGSFSLMVSNNNASGGTAETGAIIINFAIIKGVAA